MNGDIVNGKKFPNRQYVEFEQNYYRINHPDAGEEIPYRQMQFCLDGTYGELVRVVANAMQSNGFPVRMAWQGIKNSLGDYVSVCPPVTPLTKEQLENF